MSNVTQTPGRESGGEPLPDPIGEDGIIHPDDRTEDGQVVIDEEEVEELDGGLSDVGGGDPNKRKII